MSLMMVVALIWMRSWPADGVGMGIVSMCRDDVGAGFAGEYGVDSDGWTRMACILMS